MKNRTDMPHACTAVGNAFFDDEVQVVLTKWLAQYPTPYCPHFHFEMYDLVNHFVENTDRSSIKESFIECYQEHALFCSDLLLVLTRYHNRVNHNPTWQDRMIEYAGLKMEEMVEINRWDYKRKKAIFEKRPALEYADMAKKINTDLSKESIMVHGGATKDGVKTEWNRERKKRLAITAKWRPQIDSYFKAQSNHLTS